jgi:hypothetical protein
LRQLGSFAAAVVEFIVGEDGEGVGVCLRGCSCCCHVDSFVVFSLLIIVETNVCRMWLDLDRITCSLASDTTYTRAIQRYGLGK